MCLQDYVLHTVLCTHRPPHVIGVFEVLDVNRQNIDYIACKLLVGQTSKNENWREFGIAGSP